MQNNNIETLSQEVWKGATRLRGKFKAKDYPAIILPMIMLRRIECVLEQERIKLQQKHPNANEENLKTIETTLNFYNQTNWSLEKLLANEQQIETNITSYLNGFSNNVKNIIEKFDYFATIKKMQQEKRLFNIVELMAKQDFSPKRLSNLEMGYVYENLIQMFSQDDAKDTGEHFTPREIIKIMVDLMQMQEIANDKAISIYDPACGTGGMLSVAKEYLCENGKDSQQILLYGQELLAQNYAICAADMLIKGEDIFNIKHGNSLIPDNETTKDDGDQLADEKFDYMLSNPPFGVTWGGKGGYEKDAQKFTKRYAWGKVGEKSGSIPTSDGALLFLLTMLEKVKPNSEGGSKIAILFNGSPLSNGDANQGESEVRRHILQNDLLDTIVMLPDQMFFNTGIYTYIWLLNTNKPTHKKDKVLIINAREQYEKEAKSFGNKRHKITDKNRKWIANTFKNYKNSENSKIFNNYDFYFHKVKVVFWQTDENNNPEWIDEKLEKITQANCKKIFNKFGDFKLNITGDFEAEFNFNNSKNLEEHLETILKKDNKKVKELLKNEGITATINRRNYIDDVEYIPYQNDKDKNTYIPEFLGKEISCEIISWVDSENIGAEFLPNKYFYKYTPPQPTQEILQEFNAIDKEVQQLMQSLAD
jgi:type I restriction enzyme M protein